LPWLKDPDERVRWAAVDAVGRVGEGNHAAFPELTPLLDDPSPAVRSEAALALLRAGDLSQAVAVLSDPDERLRSAARDFLAARRLVPEPVRQAVASGWLITPQALGLVRESPDGEGVLLQCLACVDVQQVAAVAVFLGRSGLDVLIERLDEPGARVTVVQAIESRLKRISGVAWLAMHLDRFEPGERERLVRASAHCCTPEGFVDLCRKAGLEPPGDSWHGPTGPFHLDAEKFLENPSPAIRARACRSLAAAGRPDLLEWALSDPEPAVRIAAAEGLDRLRKPEVYEVLLDDPEPRVRDAVAFLLEQRGRFPAVPLLTVEALRVAAHSAATESDVARLAAAVTARPDLLRDLTLERAVELAVTLQDHETGFASLVQHRPELLPWAIRNRSRINLTRPAVARSLTEWVRALGPEEALEHWFPLLRLAGGIGALAAESVQALRRAAHLDRARGLFLQALEHPEPDLREVARRVLGPLGRLLLQQPWGPEELAEAARWIPVDGGERLVEPLARAITPDNLPQLLADPNPDVRASLADVLRRRGRLDDLPLSGALADPDPSVRRAFARLAAEAGLFFPEAVPVWLELGEGMLRQAVPTLRDLLFHFDREVRRCAAEALVSLGPEAAEARPALEALVDDAELGELARRALDLMG
ncbi:MAG: HEAT repeat domain-containing protein, partial [Candidatus Eremiobacterota bacterium]